MRENANDTVIDCNLRSIICYDCDLNEINGESGTEVWPSIFVDFKNLRCLLFLVDDNQNFRSSILLNFKT